MERAAKPAVSPVGMAAITAGTFQPLTTRVAPSSRVVATASTTRRARGPGGQSHQRRAPMTMNTAAAAAPAGVIRVVQAKSGIGGPFRWRRSCGGGSRGRRTSGGARGGRRRGGRLGGGGRGGGERRGGRVGAVDGEAGEPVGGTALEGGDRGGGPGTVVPVDA